MELRAESDGRDLFPSERLTAPARPSALRFPPPRIRVRHLWCAAAILITLHAAFLRWEALDRNVGALEHPRWADAVSAIVMPIAPHLRPSTVLWGPIPEPYAGGDPINYLKYAREMRHFYQAHVREPMHLAWVRLWLHASGWRDVALSYASFATSTLTVFATYLLGAAAVSPAAGLIAALMMGIELRAITASFEGQRDDTFTLLVALTAWSLVRLRQHQTWGRAAIAGLAAGAACLTRITALGLVIPSLLYLAFEALRSSRAADDGQRSRPMMFAVAGVLAVALAAPYLINCALAEGDPFYAMNYHTRYYRSAQGLAPDPSVGAGSYVVSRFAARPATTTDTAIVGLLVFPFQSKWDGYTQWDARLGPALATASAVGLLLALWSPGGRLLLVILLTSLAPYALTWSVGGGGEWRFTQHAYPLYLVAAAAALAAPLHLLRGRPAPVPSRGLVKQVLALGLACAAAFAFYFGMPFVTMGERLLAGEPVSVLSGHRDRWAFSGPWSRPIPGGAVTVRVAQAEETRVRIPMPSGTPYLLTIRMDPAETADAAQQPRVTVLLNGQHLADLALTRDPARMGTYRFQVPAGRARRFSELTFKASHTVRAGDAGPHFAMFAPDEPVAFRLWYVRLERIE